MRSVDAETLRGLRWMARRGTEQGRVRARALLAVHQSATDVAAQLGISPQAVNRWRRLARRADKENWSVEDFLARLDQPSGRPRTTGRMWIQRERAPEPTERKKGQVVSRTRYGQGAVREIEREIEAKGLEIHRATIYRAMKAGRISGPPDQPLK